MATKPDRNPNIQYPKKFDLVVIRQDEKDRFCPVFGYVEEAVPYESAGEQSLRYQGYLQFITYRLGQG